MVLSAVLSECSTMVCSTTFRVVAGGVWLFPPSFSVSLSGRMVRVSISVLMFLSVGIICNVGAAECVTFVSLADDECLVLLASDVGDGVQQDLHVQLHLFVLAAVEFFLQIHEKPSDGQGIVV